MLCLSNGAAPHLMRTNQMNNATHNLTAAQIEAGYVLNAHVGERVLVLTSYNVANIAPAAREKSVGYVTSTALRGLAARGLVKVEPMWKGAYVTVLAPIA